MTDGPPPSPPPGPAPAVVLASAGVRVELVRQVVECEVCKNRFPKESATFTAFSATGQPIAYQCHRCFIREVASGNLDLAKRLATHLLRRI